MPGMFLLLAGPAPTAAARARPRLPPRARRTPRPGNAKLGKWPAGKLVRRPDMAGLNCSGFGGPMGPDWVRNTKLTYSTPPGISPWHAGFRVVPLTGSSGRLSMASAAPVTGITAPAVEPLHPARRVELQFREGRSRMDTPDPGMRAHR